MKRQPDHLVMSQSWHISVSVQGFNLLNSDSHFTLISFTAMVVNLMIARWKLIGFVSESLVVTQIKNKLRYLVMISNSHCHSTVFSFYILQMKFHLLGTQIQQKLSSEMQYLGLEEKVNWAVHWFFGIQQEHKSLIPWL